MANVLIATLGRSPGAVTTLYDLLIETEKISIEQVHVLMTNHEDVRKAFNLVEQALKGRYSGNPQLIIPDAYEESDLKGSTLVTQGFQRRVTTALERHVAEGHNIYAGIAGGRSSMGAMLAMSAQLYKEVKGLYHVWVDRKIEERGDVDLLHGIPTDNARVQPVYFPPEDQRSLVWLPLFPLGERRKEIEHIPASQLAGEQDYQMVRSILSALPNHFTVEQAQEYLDALAGIAHGEDVTSHAARAMTVLTEAGGANLEPHFRFILEQANSSSSPDEVLAALMKRIKADDKVWWGKRAWAYWEDEDNRKVWKDSLQMMTLSSEAAAVVASAVVFLGQFWVV